MADPFKRVEMLLDEVISTPDAPHAAELALAIQELCGAIRILQSRIEQLEKNAK